MAEIAEKAVELSPADVQIKTLEDMVAYRDLVIRARDEQIVLNNIRIGELNSEIARLRDPV